MVSGKLPPEHYIWYERSTNSKNTQKSSVFVSVFGQTSILIANFIVFRFPTKFIYESTAKYNTKEQQLYDHIVGKYTVRNNIHDTNQENSHNKEPIEKQ